MKTAFVTGGAGFLGLNLVEALLDDGWEVMVFDQNTEQASSFAERGVQLIEGDVGDAAACRSALPQGVDAVFHLAGDTTHWRLGDKHQTRINVGGTRNMVDTALKKQARRFILTSSIGAYGSQAKRITEDTPSSAASSPINYWRTKQLAEMEVRQGIKKGLDAVIMNPANIIGAHDFSGWSRFFFMIDKGSLAGAPPGMASFCHAAETARAHMAAFESGRTGHNYLLGGSDATWLEFVQKIGALLDRKVPRTATPAFLLKLLGALSYLGSFVTRKEPDVTPEKALLVCTKLICSSEKAQEELGYRIRPLEEMLADCHEWLLETGRL